jgi:NAD(P)-dependent dehydrogenase (short-subunit alcohol dehydrogenase family)
MRRERQLEDRTVVVIGGTRGIGLATARLARNEVADVIITARDPERLRSVRLELEHRSLQRYRSRPHRHVSRAPAKSSRAGWSRRGAANAPLADRRGRGPQEESLDLVFALNSARQAPEKGASCRRRLKTGHLATAEI